MKTHDFDIFCDQQSVPDIRLQQRLRSIVAAGVICAALGWVFSPLNGSQDRGEGGATSVTTSIPPASGKVYHQGLRHYHWRADCPLAGARSQHPATSGRARPRISTLRHEAEKLKKIPCGLCSQSS